MKKQTKQMMMTLFLSIYLSTIFCQKTTIDFVIYEDATKTEYRIAELLKDINAEREKQNTCTTFNIVPSIEAAKSDYIFEFWEYGESVKTGIFKEYRQRKKTGANNQSITENYIAAGVKLKSMSFFLGRLYHRSSGEIINVFALDGDHVKEINDDEVKNKFHPEKSNKALEDLMLLKYEKEILKLRAEIVKDYAKTLKSAIYSTINPIVSPVVVTKIQEEKEGKLKKVLINECIEKTLNYGGFYCDLLAETKIGDKNRFLKAGSSYIRDEKNSSLNVLGIKDGEKELLPLMKNGTKIYAMEDAEKEYYLTEPSSFDKKTYDFAILYGSGLLDNFSPAQKKYIELLLQSHFVGYRDVRVIANNPFTASINNITNDAKKPEVDYGMSDVTKSNLIWVNISNLMSIHRRPSKKVLGFEISGDVHESMHFANCEIKANINDKEFIYNFEIITDEVNGFEMVLNKSLDLTDIDDNIFINSGKIHGLITLPENKNPFVLLESTLPFSKVKEFEIYENANITKKTKAIGKIKKEIVLNPYLALCEIDEGKKELLPLIEGKKNLHVKGKEPKALFGLAATSMYSSNIKYFVVK